MRVEVPAILPLFRSELQLRLLGLLILQPERGWTSSELRERLDASEASVHRELHRALDAGILRRRAIGRTHIYEAETTSPLYDPLRLLLERTVGVDGELRRALEDIPGVESAFIHGSFARSTRVKPSSDVDVVVLGRADPARVRKAVRAVEQRVGREIDVTTYGVDEFTDLLDSGSAFARSIVERPTRILIGELPETGER